MLCFLSLSFSLCLYQSSGFETKTRYSFASIKTPMKKSGNMWRPSALSSSNEKKSHSDAAVCVFQQDRLKVNSPESSFKLIEGCIYQLLKCGIYNRWRTNIIEECIFSFQCVTLSLSILLYCLFLLLMDENWFRLYFVYWLILLRMIWKLIVRINQYKYVVSC